VYDVEIHLSRKYHKSISVLGFNQEGPKLNYYNISDSLGFELQDTDNTIPEWEITADFPRWGDIF